MKSNQELDPDDLCEGYESSLPLIFPPIDHNYTDSNVFFVHVATLSDVQMEAYSKFFFPEESNEVDEGSE